VSALNIRKGPSTDYNIADDALAGGSSVRIYSERNGWYSLSPSNSINESDSRWCSKYLDDTIVWSLEEKEIEVSTGGTQTGTQFNIAKGSIVMNKNTD
jgi:SH3-like domain-containing protein